MHPDNLARRMQEAKNNLQAIAMRAAEKTGDDSLVQQAEHINDRVPQAATIQAQDLIQTERIVSVLRAALDEYDASEVPSDNYVALAERDASAIVHDTSGASEATDGSNAGIEVYDFSDLVGSDGNDALHSAGYNTPQDVRNASDEELLAVDGIGPAKLEKLRSL